MTTKDSYHIANESKVKKARKSASDKIIEHI